MVSFMGIISEETVDTKMADDSNFEEKKSMAGWESYENDLPKRVFIYADFTFWDNEEENK